MRHRLIIASETIQQFLDINTTSQYRKIQDETIDPEKTSYNNNASNDIKHGEKKQLSAVILSDSYQNVVFVEILGAILLRQNNNFCHLLRISLTLYPNLSTENIKNGENPHFSVKSNTKYDNSVPGRAKVESQNNLMELINVTPKFYEDSGIKMMTMTN